MQGFRHPIRNECMRWFAQVLRLMCVCLNSLFNFLPSCAAFPNVQDSSLQCHSNAIRPVKIYVSLSQYITLFKTITMFRYISNILQNIPIVRLHMRNILHNTISPTKYSSNSYWIRGIFHRILSIGITLLWLWIMLCNPS